MTCKNLFSEIPDQLPRELFETLLQRRGLRLERIVSHGHTTPEREWYDQEWDEWVILLSGSAELLFEDGERCAMRTGDYLFIPAHRRHRVTCTDAQHKSVWLALHLEASHGSEN